MALVSSALKSLNVLGINSGTSMDGIDAGLFRIGPDNSAAGGSHRDDACPPLKVEFLFSELIPFEPGFKRNLERFVAGGGRDCDLRTVCLIHSALGEIFAEAALRVVKQARSKGLTVDLIGSHGQTIWHEPRSSNFWGVNTSGTLQLGDPAYVAARTGVTTVGDFRTYDMAFGGQGAPLVSFADEVLFGQRGQSIGILNLGGIANVTVLDGNGQAVMAFDTGPANVLIDEAMRILYQRDYDENGQVAASGVVNEKYAAQVLKMDYFHMEPPKTTGRELFGRELASKLVEEWQANDVSDADIVATLTAITARSVAFAYRDFVAKKYPLNKLVLGGGGAENETLKRMMKEAWHADNSNGPLELASHEDYGISAKFKEALLFALLAYTRYFDIPNNVPCCTGASRRVSLGKIVTSL